MKAIKKPVEAWLIPLDEDLTRFSNELPIEVIDKIELTHYVINHQPCNIGVSYPDGALIGKTGDYIVRGSNGSVWVVQKDTFEDEYEVVEDE